MAEFCDNCPMRGTIQDEIVSISFLPIVLQKMHPIGSGVGLTKVLEEERRYSLAFDSSLNMSLPFWGTFQTEESMLTKISDCNGAEESQTKFLFFKLKSSKFCPALGKLAITPQSPGYEFITSGLK